MTSFLDIRNSNIHTVSDKLDVYHKTSNCVCVIYNDILDEWLFFIPNNKDICSFKSIMKKIYFKNYFSSDISDLYSFLQRDFAVGFDLKKFKHIFMPQVHSKKEKDPFNFDIFEYISNFTGRPISLDNIAAQTLQVGLNHKSKLPVIEWETENMKNHLDVYRNIEHGYHISAGINIYNTIDQCRHNVELVHGIYTFGVENGYISYLDKGSNTVLKMEVDW